MKKVGVRQQCGTEKFHSILNAAADTKQLEVEGRNERNINSKAVTLPWKKKKKKQWAILSGTVQNFS